MSDDNGVTTSVLRVVGYVAALAAGALGTYLNSPLQVVAFALTGLVASASIVLSVWLRPTTPRTMSIDDRVRALRGNLDRSSRLIREINAEFELQAAEAERIKAEAEQNQRLAELNAEQARAVQNLVESVQGRASRLGSRQQWLFFLAGLLFAIPLGVAGNFAFELVKAWLAS